MKHYEFPTIIKKSNDPTYVANMELCEFIKTFRRYNRRMIPFIHVIDETGTMKCYELKQQLDSVAVEFEYKNDTFKLIFF